MLDAQTISSQTGLFGDVVDSVSRIASTISLAPGGIVVKPFNVDSERDQTQLSRKNSSVYDSSFDSDGLKRCSSFGKSPNPAPLESALAKTEKIIHQPTTYSTALSKAAFFDKVIGAVQEGLDETSALAKAARQTTYGGGKNDTELTAIRDETEEGERHPFQTSVQHLGLHLLQHEFKSKQKPEPSPVLISPGAAIIVGTSDPLKKQDGDSTVDQIDKTATSIHNEVAKAHAPLVITSGLAADGRLTKLKTIVNRLSKVSSTPYTQGGLVGMTEMNEDEFSDEPPEMRRIKQKYARLMILVNDYDTICDGAEYARERTLKETYQKWMDSCLEKNTQDLKNEYEKKIDHTRCQASIQSLTSEVNLLKDEAKRQATANESMKKELEELRLYKLGTEGEQELLVEQLAKRRMKQRSLKKQMKKALIKIESLQTELTQIKGDLDTPPQAATQESNTQKRMGSASTVRTNKSSHSQVAFADSKEPIQVQSHSNRPRSGKSGSRPFSASTVTFSINHSEFTEDESNWESEGQRIPTRDGEDSDSDDEFFQNYDSDELMEENTRPKWNKSTTTNLLSQKSPPSVIYTTSENNTHELQTQCNHETPKTHRNELVKRWKYQKMKLQEALYQERQKRHKLYVMSAKKSNMSRKLTSILLDCLKSLSIENEHLPESQEWTSAMKITDGLSERRMMIENILDGLDTTITPTDLNDEPLLDDELNDKTHPEESKYETSMRGGDGPQDFAKGPFIASDAPVPDNLMLSIDQLVAPIKQNEKSKRNEFRDVKSWIKTIDNVRPTSASSSKQGPTIANHSSVHNGKHHSSSISAIRLNEGPLEKINDTKVQRKAVHSRPTSAKSATTNSKTNAVSTGAILPKLSSQQMTKAKTQRPVSAPVAGGYGRLQIVKKRGLVAPKPIEERTGVFEIHGQSAHHV